jgi:hypothetical protein
MAQTQLQLISPFLRGIPIHKGIPFLTGALYHRERIYFSSTLSCNKKEEKKHQTSHFERMRPLQSTKQL